MKAADVKFELWLKDDGKDESPPITGKFSVKSGRVLTAAEWDLVVECVQQLIWQHEKYNRSEEPDGS